MMALRVANLLVFCALAALLGGCMPGSQSSEDEFLRSKNVVGVELSAPRGSGGIRKLTIRYRQDGREKQDALENVSRVDCKSYQDGKKEQELKPSDFNSNQIFTIVIYREFWFPDISLSHAEIPEWPTIYEFSLKDGFTIASSRHKGYFSSYIKASGKSLSLYARHMSGNAIAAQTRLLLAAEQIKNGSFEPQSPYNSRLYYEDVYELTKP